MFCGKCGEKRHGDERFCRNCGNDLEDSQEDVVESYPSQLPQADTAAVAAPAPALVAPPVSAAAPDVPAGRSRPRWLVPAVAGVALLVVAVVAVIVVTSSSSTPPALSQQAEPLVAPVSEDVSELSGRLATARSSADLVPVRTAATRLGRDAKHAAAQVRQLKLRSADKQAGAVLAGALDDAADYGDKAAAAARDPRPATTGPAQDAAATVRSSFVAASAALPELKLPRSSQFSVASIGAVAAATARHAAQTKNALARDRAYVQQIDSLLRNSADTRGNLGDLIAGVQNGTISAVEAKSQIASIVNQRQDLQNSVAAVDAPAPFQRSEQLLRDALTSAIADDLAIQGWLDAWLSNDAYTYNSYWQKHMDATSQATQKKQQFVSVYDNARRRTLKLGPLPVGSDF